MPERPDTDAVVVRLDDHLGRALLVDAEPEQLRLAPSVRGLDLAEAGAVMLVVAGHTADFVTLMLAKEYISAFAVRLTSIVRGRRRGESGHLKVTLTSPRGKMAVDLTTSDPGGLADALRALATVSETAVLPLPIRGEDYSDINTRLAHQCGGSLADEEQNQSS